MLDPGTNRFNSRVAREKVSFEGRLTRQGPPPSIAA